MARKEKDSGGGGGGGGWIVTFSDLMTLLLTFFVLLLSMASVDQSVVTQISATFSTPFSIMDMKGLGRMPERIQLLAKLLVDPVSVVTRHERIKDLLFPEELLPEGMNYGNLQQNLQVIERPGGVAIVLTDSVLFDEGSPDLDENGTALLELLVPVILSMNADVNISGHTDNTVGAGISNYDLSALRAFAALEIFLNGRIPPDRFSISGYGMDRPLYPNDTPERRAMNRRIEILLKTTGRVPGL